MAVMDIPKLPGNSAQLPTKPATRAGNPATSAQLPATLRNLGQPKAARSATAPGGLSVADQHSGNRADCDDRHAVPRSLPPDEPARLEVAHPLRDRALVDIPAVREIVLRGHHAAQPHDIGLGLRFGRAGRRNRSPLGPRRHWSDIDRTTAARPETVERKRQRRRFEENPKQRRLHQPHVVLDLLDFARHVRQQRHERRDPPVAGVTSSRPTRVGREGRCIAAAASVRQLSMPQKALS